MAAAWPRRGSLLAVRLDGMGDVLMTTPALRALKESAPARSIVLLASPAGAAVAKGLPFVDAAISFRAPWVKSSSPATPRECSALVDELRERAFDAAVVFTVCTQSALPAALLVMLAGIPRCLAHARENPYALIPDWVADPDADVRAGVRHEVRRQLDLVARTGAVPGDERLSYAVPQRARETLLARARACGADATRPWIVVHPGATAPSRRYPLPSLAAAAGMLARDARWQVVLAGGDDERAALDGLQRTAPAAIRLPHDLALDELAALLERAAVVVCNNSGPAHLAAAVGTPVVDLYAQTNPQHTPWGVPHVTLSHAVPCHGCLKSVCPERHHRCLASIPPEAIPRAVDSLFAPAQERAA